MKIASVMNASATGLVLVLCVAALPADAQTQWKWRGTDGKVQYSDRPPPSEVAEKNILGRPAGASRPQVTEVAAAPPVAKASDPQLEAKKREAEQAEKSKQKAEEEKLDKQRAENCGRARTYAKTLQDGMRVSRPNEKGENELLNDTQRAQELARAQQVISADCR